MSLAYTPLRHAYVGESGVRRDRVMPVEWVMVSRWNPRPQGVEFCVEFLDACGEVAGDDACFRTEQDAERYAAAEFGLTPEDWRDGAPQATPP